MKNSEYFTKERALGIPYSNISKACRKGDMAGGYHWEYVN